MPTKSQKVAADELQQPWKEAEAEAATAPTFEVILSLQQPAPPRALDAAGVKFTVRTPATRWTSRWSPIWPPTRRGRQEARRAQGRRGHSGGAGPENYTGMLIVIGADTMVVLDGKIFGKPRSASDGKHMLGQLSGRTHEVITAVSVWMVAAPNAEDVSLGFRTFADKSYVTFRDLTDEGDHRVPAEGRVLRQGRAPTPSKVRGRRSLTTTTAPSTPSSACLRHASSRNSPTS